jgi:hypothetical protein
VPGLPQLWRCDWRNVERQHRLAPLVPRQAGDLRLIRGRWPSGAGGGGGEASPKDEPCWERLDMRSPADAGTSATVYKGGRRQRLVVRPGTGLASYGGSGANWAPRASQGCAMLHSQPAACSVLQDEGNFTIVASFGDQFSDLSGVAPAAASFKMPNPVRTLPLWCFIECGVRHCSSSS